MSRYFVYILANKSRVLYVGVTNDLVTRVAQHRVAHDDSFTSRYRVFHLMYWEEYPDARAAIAREKQIKRWRRDKKVWLIERANPMWIDRTSQWDKSGEFAIFSRDPCRNPNEE